MAPTPDVSWSVNAGELVVAGAITVVGIVARQYLKSIRRELTRQAKQAEETQDELSRAITELFGGETAMANGLVDVVESHDDAIQEAKRERERLQQRIRGLQHNHERNNGKDDRRRGRGYSDGSGKWSDSRREEGDSDD